MKKIMNDKCIMIIIIYCSHVARHVIQYAWILYTKNKLIHVKTSRAF